jgi:site-specific DNA-methyltransferase (adenine-specific)
MYEYKGYKPPKNGWAISREKMEQWDKEGRLHFPKDPNGRIQRRRFLDELRGKPVQNLWDDIQMISSQSGERLGYPTQKPVPLLKRIINASSKEGDVVLDPFCGCGTTLVAANELKRKWIGIDITYLAVFLMEQRLEDSFGESIKNTYKVNGNPEDVESAQALWNKSPKEFELWALRLVDAKPRPQDGGVDGVLGFVDEGRETKRIIVQVKGGEHLAPTIIRDLKGTIGDEKAAMGLLITLHPVTSGMMERAIHAGSYHSALWNKSFPLIQIRTIHELLIEHKGFDLPPQVTMLKQAERIRGQGAIQSML